MTARNISAYGIYGDGQAVTSAVQALKDAGFRSTDISILYPDGLGSQDFAHERHTKAPEGAVTGGGSGAVIGAALGWLVGAGSLALPGFEAMAAAGPAMGMLGGMGLGVTVGGLSGAIAGAGVPEYEAKRYAGQVRKGSILVSVHCDNPEWAKQAKAMLKKTGARDISTASESKADFARSEKPMPRSRAGSSTHLQHR